MSDIDRNYTFTIGGNTGDIVTKCSAISEGHLAFQFKKDTRNDTYEITVKREGVVLFKPPRMNQYSKMSGSEKIESHELIGKSADFRISDKTSKERMIDYIEIGLTASFFFDKIGRERMRFTFSINKINPGFNLKVKNRNGLFPFGKDSSQPKETSEYEVEEEIEN